MIALIKRVVDCEINNSSKMMMAHAIIWAAVMIASSLILKGSEQSESMFLIVLSGATASFLLSQNEGKRE